MNDITPYQPQEIQRIAESEMSVDQLVARVSKIGEVMAKVMKKDTHYGAIPGTGSKPTLLKPGAELLAVTFQLAPSFEHQRERDGNHLTIFSTCNLRHIGSGRLLGSGSGSCSTRESKYAWRAGSRKCPKCRAEAIIKGKEEYGGGWLCYAKKGGCGAKFADGDQAIEGQSTGRVENPDLADIENTVVKMADKRSLIAATLIVTGASSMFTQDIGDDEDSAVATVSRPTAQEMAPKAATPTGMVKAGLSKVEPRTSGQKTWLDVHLQMEDGTDLVAACWSKTVAETAKSLTGQYVMVSLEAKESNGRKFHNLKAIEPCSE